MAGIHDINYRRAQTGGRGEAPAKKKDRNSVQPKRNSPPKAITGAGAMANAASPTSLGAPYTSTRHGDTAQSLPISGTPPRSIAAAQQMQGSYGQAPSQSVAAQSVSPSAMSAAAAAPSYSSNPSGTGWNGGTTDTIDGYLKQFGYTPQGLGQLYDNPQPLAQDVLGTRGITNPGMAQELAELFDMFQASQFVNNRGGSATDNDTLNYIANAMQQAITPGGQYMDPYYFMQTILGQNGGQGNPLSSFLGGDNLTPDQQMSRVNQLIANGLPGMNPYAQQAYGGFLQDQQNQYREGIMKGDPNAQSYFDFLQQSQLGNWIR
jgi:hypothetical protein